MSATYLDQLCHAVRLMCQARLIELRPDTPESAQAGNILSIGSSMQSRIDILDIENRQLKAEIEKLRSGRQ